MLEITFSMIVKIGITGQYIAKALIAISKITVFWAIAFLIQPQSLVIAQPTTDVEDTSTLATTEKIRVQGYTIFSDREIEKIVYPYRGRQLNFDRLRIYPTNP